MPQPGKEIEGVALIGHATIVEARTDHAVAAFAQLAAHSQHAYLIRGERHTVETFWQHNAEEGQQDPEGFRARMRRRIDQQRIWIWRRDGKAIFKVDIVGNTPEMIYLEGIHVHPDEREKGYGKRCLLQLSSIFARPGRSICLTINDRRANAVAFYARAGFDYHSEYETIYLRKE